MYWIAAVIMTSCILTSLGYKFSEALFIGTTFLPGAMAVRYFYPKAVSDDPGNSMKNLIFLSLGIIVSQIFIVLLAHILINILRDDVRHFYFSQELPEILMNPIFIAVITVIISVGYHFMEQWLKNKYPHSQSSITFLSDRRPITLKIDEILYVESNDSVTTVYASENRRYKNKTSISKWEANLGRRFVRIHRSYLVNKSTLKNMDSDTVYIGEKELPISRKYRRLVKNID